MEYRLLPHGSPEERLSVLGLGVGGMGGSSEDEIEATARLAVESGINFFDMCAGHSKVYAPFGRGIEGHRQRIFMQLHFGAVYNENGDYGWTKDLDRIRETVSLELSELGTDYTDFGFLHCVDSHADFRELSENGVLDYIKELKSAGVVRHIGFSSHTPSVAEEILDTGLADMMMFSINPAYDMEQGDEYGIGTFEERMRLFRRCRAEGVGISVMKPFLAGQLLEDGTSPFGRAMTRTQCISYALDRPGVLTVVPGCRNRAELRQVLDYLSATPEERDYSAVAQFTPQGAKNSCVYCNHCQPCPAGIDVGLVNKYYDLSLAGDVLARDHYRKLETKASACASCGHCNSRCPFEVDQVSRMAQIAAHFGE